MVALTLSSKDPADEMRGKNDAIVDIQGFHLPTYGFILKEICILTDNSMFHWIFLPPESLWLSNVDVHQIKWAAKNYHKIAWEDGYYKYEEAQSHITLALENVEKIFVKGLQKCQWLKPFLPRENIKIINVEDMDCNLRLKDDMFYKISCSGHSGICSVSNVFKINVWFEVYYVPKNK